MLSNKTKDSIKKNRYTNLMEWQGTTQIIKDDESTKINELEQANKMWASQNVMSVGTTKREAPKLQEIIASRKNTLTTNWSSSEGLTPWQEYAAKTFNGINEPLLLLLFHDANVNYLVDRSRKTAASKKELGKSVTPKPTQRQIVESLLTIYDNLRYVERKDLRSLLIQANKNAVSSIMKKLKVDESLQTRFIETNGVQPLPQVLSVNVNKGGMRSLSGGKPFVV